MQSASDEAVKRINQVHLKVAARIESKEPFSTKAAMRLSAIYGEALAVLTTELEHLKTTEQQTLKDEEAVKEMEQEERKREQEILDAEHEQRRAHAKPKGEVNVNEKKRRLSVERDRFAPGEQVAAKIQGEWILATVLGSATNGQYKVQDAEDDGFIA